MTKWIFPKTKAIDSGLRKECQSLLDFSIPQINFSAILIYRLINCGVARAITYSAAETFAITWPAYMACCRDCKTHCASADEKKNIADLKCVAPTPPDIHTRLQKIFFPSQKLIGCVYAVCHRQILRRCKLFFGGVRDACGQLFLIYKELHLLKLNHSKIYSTLIHLQVQCIRLKNNFKSFIMFTKVET